VTGINQCSFAESQSLGVGYSLRGVFDSPGVVRIQRTLKLFYRRSTPHNDNISEFLIDGIAIWSLSYHPIKKLLCLDVMYG
jgi:hypothetical protein